MCYTTLTCLAFQKITDILSHKIGRQNSHFYCASACNAWTAWYCFTNSVCLSICPMPVLCQNIL